MNDRNNKGRGFAGMDQARQREIARQGGIAAHRSGNAHEFDSESGREAGRKGGLSRANRNKNNANNTNDQNER